MINTRKKQTEFFELSKLRRRFVLVMILSLFFALFSRAIYLQAMQKDFLQKEAKNRSDRNVILHAYRGKIIDRNNNVFAVSTPVQVITANPAIFEASAKKKIKLARLLSLSQRDLEKKVQKKKKKVFLNRQLSPEKAVQVMALKIPGVSSNKDYKRFYPAKEVAAHLVGFTGIDGYGLEGIELYSNKLLAGESGYKKILKTEAGRIVDDLQDVKIPRDGQDIQLSIDINDQIMGLVKISRTYWLVPDSEGGIEEELIVTIEGKALEKESSNQSRNSLCESWIEDYLPLAAVKRNLVDGERLSDLDPSKIDDEIISGIDDITGIGLLHKISRRLNYVKRKTLQSLAPDDKKEGLNALMELLNEIKKEKAEVNSDLKEKIDQLNSTNGIVIQLQEEIENTTRSDGSGNVQLRMNYAIKQSELSSCRKSIHELTFQSMPFLIAGVPKDLSE